MRNFKQILMVLCVGLLFAFSLKADEWDKLTKVTFSGPVEVAGNDLPAGTYWFKIFDGADRNVVQVLSEDMNHSYAIVMAHAAIRPTAGKTEFKFAESQDGSQESGTLPESGIPIKDWFYPGDTIGIGFPVVSHPEVAALEPPPAPQSEAAPEPQPEEPQAQATTPTETPTEPATQAAPTGTAPEIPAPETSAPAQQQPPEQLPQTASQLPLLGLLGILALAAAASLRIFLKLSA